MARGKGSVEKEGVRIGLRILTPETLNPETVKCLAFDAVAAWRVISLDCYARDEPETPAAAVMTEDEREVIDIAVRGERLVPPAQNSQPFPPDIRSCEVLLTRIAG